MTISHTGIERLAAPQTATLAWQPIQPPSRNASEAMHVTFNAYMLLPGLSLAFHTATLKRSRATIATYRLRARQAANDNPKVGEMILAQLGALRPDHGLQMAQSRGSAQLPHWSLLAIAHYREQGISRLELSAIFCCSRGTIANALRWNGRSYDPLSGSRRLSATQLSPPGQFARRVI